MLEEIKISLLIEFSAAVLSRGLQAASTGCFLSYHDGFHFFYYFKKKKKKKKGGEAGKKKSHLQLPEVSHSVWDCRVRWLTVSEVDLTKKYIFEQSRELWTSKDPQCNTILFFDGPLLEQWKVQASIMGLVVLGDSHLASEYWYKNLEAPLLSISYNSTLL